ncbi:MAG: LexA family transcriptional regulator [Bacteroidaceae bacterium]|nr:LexA family transcriptional regulator [Bacteroidaceae bacterium]
MVLEKSGGNVKAFADLIRVPQQNLDRIFKIDRRNSKYPAISAEIKQALYAEFGYTEVWLFTEDTSKTTDDSEVTKSTEHTSGVPYYNVDFTLGFDILVNDQTTQPDYYVNFPPYNKCTCWINARGDSMTPTISAGDMVALQRIEDFRVLISGEVYAIVTRNGLRTIKRVNDLGDSLRLIPDNKDYEEQVISKSDILGVFYVKGNVKAF